MKRLEPNERVLEKRNAQKKRRQQQGDIYTETASTYRIFSRAFCNYVFPREIGRPMKERTITTRGNFR